MLNPEKDVVMWCKSLTRAEPLGEFGDEGGGLEDEYLERSGRRAGRTAMTPRQRILLLDALHAWHRIAGSREMTVAAMAPRLGLSMNGRIRLGHQLRQANGMAIFGYRAIRGRMTGGKRRWRVARVRVSAEP